MKTTEAAALLTICAAYDNRKPDADQAKAWAMALDGLRFEDCREAIVQHYRASREWIMPADVYAAVNRTRRSRIEDAEPIPIPPGFDPDDTAAYQRLLAEARRAQADGRGLEMPEYEATRHIGELRHVLRAVPELPGKPREKSAEHKAAKAAAAAELGPPAPMPGLTDPEPAQPTAEEAPA